jgi:hypothetical protein
MFSFNKGKMDIQLPRTSYIYDEPIEGKVTMELNKPQKGKGVFIQILGERNRRENYTTTKNGKTVHGTRTVVDVVFERSLILDGEKEYPSGHMEYPFQFVVADPGVAQTPNFGDGVIGNALNFMAQHAVQAPIEWKLKAKLDVPGFDVNKEFKLDVLHASKPQGL